MKISGKVLNATQEQRELVGKDGNKRLCTISHLLLLVEQDGITEVLNCRSFDSAFGLPKVGANFSSAFKKIEFNGAVGEVLL